MAQTVRCLIADVTRDMTAYPGADRAAAFRQRIRSCGPAADHENYTRWRRATVGRAVGRGLDGARLEMPAGGSAWLPPAGRIAVMRRGTQPQALPLTENLVGLASLLVQVPWKPSVTLAPAAMVPL